MDELTTYVQIDRILMTWVLFGLTLVRCSALAVFAPFFGAEQFPARLRILLAVFLAIVMFPLAAPHAILPPVIDMPQLGILALQELSIGITIGFFCSLIFIGAQISGQLVGQQLGIGLANILDPVTGADVSIIGFLKMNVMLVLFLVMNLHLAVVWLLKMSYDAIAIGELAFSKVIAPLNEIAVVEGHAIWVISVQLAMPVLVAMLLNSVVEGFITRTMPQMNIMVLGLPLRVALGVTVLMLVLPSLVEVMAMMLQHYMDELGEAMRLIDVRMHEGPA